MQGTITNVQVTEPPKKERVLITQKQFYVGIYISARLLKQASLYYLENRDHKNIPVSGKGVGKNIKVLNAQLILWFIWGMKVQKDENAKLGWNIVVKL